MNTFRKRQHDEARKEDELEKARLAYCQDILNKRYDLYTWIDGKARIALSVNGLFLGLSYWLLKNGSEKIVFQLPMFIGITALVLSILVLLTVALPAMMSPAWKTMPEKLIIKQPRTAVGINEFKGPAEYMETIKSLTMGQMIEYNVDQIWKMNKIILDGSKKVSLASRIIGISTCLILVAALLEPLSESTYFKSFVYWLSALIN